MDCTFKLHDNKFPLVIIGVTDAAQKFHVLSVSIVFYHTYPMYLRVVQGLKDIISRLYPQVSVMPHYIMTDAEVAERKALLPVFLEAQPLMCYFHVKKACKYKLRGNAEKGVIFQNIGELHLTLTQGEFDTNF
jgi:hypothetical protein